MEINLRACVGTWPFPSWSVSQCYILYYLPTVHVKSSFSNPNIPCFYLPTELSSKCILTTLPAASAPVSEACLYHTVTSWRLSTLLWPSLRLLLAAKLSPSNASPWGCCIALLKGLPPFASCQHILDAAHLTCMFCIGFWPDDFLNKEEVTPKQRYLRKAVGMQ